MTLYCVTLTRTIPVYDRNNKTADRPDKVRQWSQHIQCHDLREAEEIASRLMYVSSELKALVSVRVWAGNGHIVMPIDCVMQIAQDYNDEANKINSGLLKAI